METSREALACCPLFQGLDDGALGTLVPLFVERRLEAGEPLFFQGDTGDAMYVVASGAVRLVRGQGPSPRVLAELGAGEVLGEMSLVTDSPRTAGAEASEDLTLWVLTRERFDELRHRAPGVHTAVVRNLAVVLCSRLRDVTARSAVLLQRLSGMTSRREELEEKLREGRGALTNFLASLVG